MIVILIIYIYIYIYIYVYAYSQNCDNVTMYYYMYFTTLLHVIYCVYFHYMHPDMYCMEKLKITGAFLSPC